jgi:DNA-binding NtrC family response regulator
MAATEAARVAVDPLLAIVIDDDAKIRQLIETTLTQLGLNAASFDMAREALAAIDRGHPAIIFLDVALLRSDAIDVLRGLGQRRFGGIVQLISGGRPALLEAVQRIGVRHGIRLAMPLNKPLAREAIVRVIESMRSPDATPSAERGLASQPAAARR